MICEAGREHTVMSGLSPPDAGEGGRNGSSGAVLCWKFGARCHTSARGTWRHLTGWNHVFTWVTRYVGLNPGRSAEAPGAFGGLLGRSGQRSSLWVRPGAGAGGIRPRNTERGGAPLAPKRTERSFHFKQNAFTFTQNQRANAKRITHANQHVVSDANQ